MDDRSISQDDYDLAAELGLSDRDLAEARGVIPDNFSPVHRLSFSEDGTPAVSETIDGRSRVMTIQPDRTGSTAYAADVLREKGYVR